MTTYHALEHRFRLDVDDVRLRRYVEDVFAPLAARAVGDANASTYTLRVGTESANTFELYADDTCVVTSLDPTRPLAHLLNHVNVTAIERSSGNTLLHAAAASSTDGAVIFPAAMEAGKSTLVAGLTRAGWSYITDEVVAIDPVDRLVRPYPRSISLDPGSWPLFRDVAPHVDPAIEPFLPRQWQVPPTWLGSVQAGPIPITAIVTHAYVEDSETILEELDPVECLRRILACCFTLPQHAERDLTTLAALIDLVPCYFLQVGDLEGACRELTSEFEP